MVFGFNQEVPVFQGINHNWAGLDGRKVGNVVPDARLDLCFPECIRIQEALMVQQGDAGELVPFTCLEIIEVVSRGDFDGAGPKFPVYQDPIAHDWNSSVGERQFDTFSDMPIVSGVLRMHCYRGVAE